MIINSKEDLKLDDADVHTIDATGIALDVLGVPIVNTVMLGSFAKIIGGVSLESIIKIIKETFPGKIGEKNAKAAKIAYEKVI